MQMRVHFAWLTILPLFMLGCSGGESLELIETKGKVLLGGEPVEGAVVTFYPEDGPAAQGRTDASGLFTLSTNGEAGAVAGKHRIAVTKSSEAPPSNTPEDLSAAAESAKAFPAKYADPATSKLEETVSADGENNFELKLEK